MFATLFYIFGYAFMALSGIVFLAGAVALLRGDTRGLSVRFILLPLFFLPLAAGYLMMRTAKLYLDAQELAAADHWGQIGAVAVVGAAIILLFVVPYVLFKLNGSTYL